MRRGQSVPEYAVLISILAAAVLAMQTFMRRGVQLQIKKLTDVALAIVPEDATSVWIAKRGEQTQLFGMTDTGESSSNRSLTSESDYTVVREAPGITTFQGLQSRTTEVTDSIFEDESEIPPDFLRRDRVFFQLSNVGKEPIPFYPRTPPLPNADPPQ